MSNEIVNDDHISDEMDLIDWVRQPDDELYFAIQASEFANALVAGELDVNEL